MQLISEKTPLVNQDNDDVVIELESSPEIVNPSPDLLPDVIEQISHLVSYKDGLAALRRTSKSMYQLIENTPAGQLARKAANLEPNFLQSRLAYHVSSVKDMDCCWGGLSLSGMALGVFVFAVSGIASSQGSWIGGALGSGIGGNTIGNAVAWGFYSNRKRVADARKEIQGIREQLKEPITENSPSANSQRL